ncbi:MAG TPA: glycerophosphodiester phosphodiesterase [Roseateles sp.]|nr:glycerophosphodiester phosphodiesterase [Roseateles sp.]
MSGTPWPMPFWIAHRGAGRLAPENTLAAFRYGAQHGWRAFECDVKLSSDGVPFLLHDATLNRTTPERGVAGERPWAELSRIDAGARHGRGYAGEPIPSLDALARYCIANRFALNIEIKPTPGLERHTGEVVGREARRLWAGSGMLPLFSSFQPEALAGARATAPEIARGLLVDTLWEGWLDTALALGCSAVISNYVLMRRALVEQLHAAGLKAVVYTVNDPAAAQWLLANGVDGIISDAVDRFSPAAT